MLEVKRRDLPPLDDELAKLHGQYETLDELRDNLRENLERQAEQEAKDALIEEMVDGLLVDAEIVYPPAAITIELDEVIESFKQQAERSGWQWDDYLRLQGQSEEDVRDDFSETAVERLKRRLVLQEFIRQEKLTVVPEDVDDIIEARVADMGDNPELQDSMREFYKQGYGLEMLSTQVLMDKVHGRVIDIYAGEAPDLDAIAEAESLMSDEEE